LPEPKPDEHLSDDLVAFVQQQLAGQPSSGLDAQGFCPGTTVPSTPPLSVFVAASEPARADGNVRRPSNAKLLSWAACQQSARRAEGGIGIIGLSGSGKTAYLYVLGRRDWEHDFDQWRLSTLRDEYIKFISAQEATLDHWQKTHDTELTGLELFHMQRQRVNATQCVKDTITVTTCDTGGEAIRLAFAADFDHRTPIVDSTAINGMRQFFSRCEGFMIILDCQQAIDNAKADSLAKQQFLWKLVFERLRKLDSGVNGYHIERPLAIVLNKADCVVNEERGDDDLCITELIHLRRTRDRKQFRQRMRDTLHVRKTAARAFIGKFYPTIYAYFDAEDGDPIASTAECFAVSCWGRQPVPETNVGTDIYPVGVEEPLRWLSDAICTRRAAQQGIQHMLSKLRLKYALWAAVGLVVLWVVWLFARA
jgi:hypothetical protein